ncbi:hypothetical protein QWZ10_11130 [Paracoccus cavernae]|uniref:Uncharacterized protein n=1 Tax=Paracoccus cavernae TaxID=1571207 RepID=A0ABT8D8N7_9RHOB|nr:hypothetical protein [Paracoccus cavernae]
MRVGLDRAEIVDRDDLDIGPARFHNRAKHVATNTSEAVDCYLNSHGIPLPLIQGSAANSQHFKAIANVGIAI